MQEIELSGLDLRYEGCRLKSPLTEKSLLCSISAHGVRDPLQGVDVFGQRILLDGFKRYRCAKKLNIGSVPYTCLGDDEVCGIIDLIRISNTKSLGILEQARLIEELKSVHKMCNSDIADLLEKSKAWVSVRSGIMGEMSACVMQKIFDGQFPVYAFMYTLRRFIRLNSVRKEEIDEFVKSVAGKHLSIRDIDILANGYFKGSAQLREQIRNGNLSWGLKRLKEGSKPTAGCSKREQAILKALEIVSRYMHKLSIQLNDTSPMSNGFAAQANLSSGAVLRQTETFFKVLRQFYDRTGKA